jgi:hypothetical protein
MSEICNSLHHLFQIQPLFRFPFKPSDIPKNGIYVLFEQGEIAHGTNRIVRVGTHTGDKQLRSRLQQHFIKENKDRSIFRKNIGRAILSKDKDTYLESWELDLTTRQAKAKYSKVVDVQQQKKIERKVTEQIQRNFSFSVFQVDDKSRRLDLESKIISTVSLCDECTPSPNWLGLHSPKSKIRESGLWIVNELYKQPLTESDYKLLRETVCSN